MKALFVFCLVLGALPGLGGSRQTTVAPIALYTTFQHAPPAAVVLALHDELETIMRPLGLRFEWRSLSAVSGDAVAVELAVLSFKGRCDAGSLQPQRVASGALGWTHVSDGIILPFSDVDCDRIRAFVQKDLRAIGGGEREAVFGRAVARVVAHELYHIFANTSRHGSCGIGKAAYTVQELLAADFQFEPPESEALRGSKAYESLEQAGRPATLD